MKGVRLPRPDRGGERDPTRWVWRQVTALGSDFELRRDDDVLGELGRPMGGGLGAWAECFGEEWRVGAVVAFSGRIRVRLVRAGTRSPGCGYEGFMLRRGRVWDAGGARLRWSRRIFGGRNRLHDPFGGPLLEAWHVHRRMFYRDVHVRLTPEGRVRDDVGQLLVLVAFLIVQAESGFHRPFRMGRGRDPLPRHEDFEPLRPADAGPDALEPGPDTSNPTPPDR